MATSRTGLSWRGFPVLVGCILALLFMVLTASGGTAQTGSPKSQERATDPVNRLRMRIDAGEVQLAYDSIRGYVPALLAALDIPISSQNLVFSRTSLQTDRIAPWAPRALYFSDDVYVGWVQESPIIEIASMSLSRGAVFFTLLQNPEGPPRFEREGTTCLMCHESRITENVPGLIMRSVLADRLGYPSKEVHQGQTTDRTAFEKRWAGWYVTGTHGIPGHAGNTRAPELDSDIRDRSDYLSSFDFHAGGNVTDLSDNFDVERYLTPHSDIVSLMVLTHQVRIHNLITLARRSLAAVDRLVRAMLFVDEATLPGPVQGTSTFVKDFTARGPSDSQGRSLRDFDLEQRLFRYPLSFLIYSDQFNALPDFALNRIYDRLGEILTVAEPGEDFVHLSAPDRRAIYEILLATKPAFADRMSKVEVP